MTKSRSFLATLEKGRIPKGSPAFSLIESALTELWDEQVRISIERVQSKGQANYFRYILRQIGDELLHTDNLLEVLYTVLYGIGEFETVSMDLATKDQSGTLTVQLQLIDPYKANLEDMKDIIDRIIRWAAVQGLVIMSWKEYQEFG